MYNLINVLLAVAVGTAAFVIEGCSTTDSKFRSLKEGMTEHEVMLAVGRPHKRLVVNSLPTYMWCENGTFGSTFRAVHFRPVSRTSDHSTTEIINVRGDCSESFRAWGERLERMARIESGATRDEIEMVMERW